MVAGLALTLPDGWRRFDAARGKPGADRSTVADRISVDEQSPGKASARDELVSKAAARVAIAV
jgi:hypothetical protein